MEGAGELVPAEITEIANLGVGFSAASIKRAEIAVLCSPFTLGLLSELAEKGISLRTIAASEGTQNHYLTRSVGFAPAENALLWLVQVGVLRREVDGQGITDSFRLTPLGCYVIELWRSQGSFPKPKWGDRLQNFLAQIHPARFL